MTDKHHEVEQRMQDLLDQAQEIQNVADSESRELSEDEVLSIEALHGKFKVLEMERSSIPMAPKASKEMPRSRQVHALSDSHRYQQPATSGLFDPVPESYRSPWANFGDWLGCVANTVRGRIDPRLSIANSANEGTGSEGGYFVPSELRTSLLGPIFTDSPILSRVDIVRMSTNNLAVAGGQTTDRSSGAVAGVELSWVAEGSQISESTPDIKVLNLRACKGAALVAATNELLMDAPAASRQLEEIFRSTARYSLEKSILRGTGAGMPRGVLNDPSLVSVAKRTSSPSQSADTIEYVNLANMLTRMHPASLPRSIWVCSPSAMSELLQLSFRVQNLAGSDFVGGQQIQVLTDQAGQFSLLGRPLYVAESLPPLGDTGDLLLVDLSQYLFGMRTDVSIAVSPHEKFSYDSTTFRMTVRVDGAGKWDQAVETEYDSTNTLSWAVKIDARA